MSKLNFLDDGARELYPRETRRVELGDYGDHLKGDYLDVWVNWTRAKSDLAISLAMDAGEIVAMKLGKERDKVLAKLNEKMFQHQADWWGISVDEVMAIHAIDTALSDFITIRATELRREYIEDRKKVGSDLTATSKKRRNSTRTRS